MAVTWKIKINGGSAQALAAAGIGGCVVEKYHLATDRILFDAAEDYGDTPILADGDSVELIREIDAPPSSVTYFKGKVAATPWSGAPEAVGADYLVEGPWGEMERTTYQQAAASAIDTDADPEIEALGTEAVYTPEICLCEDDSGSQRSTTAEAAAAVAYAAACGVGIAAGTYPSAYFPRQSKFTDLSVARAIREVLDRWEKNLVAWVDYTNATPTLEITDAESVTAPEERLDYGSAPLSAIDVNEDLTRKPPAVCLTYKRLNEIDGKVRYQLTKDIYPAEESDQQVGVPVFYVPMKGVQARLEKQPVRTETMPKPKGDEDFDEEECFNFWKKRNKRLADLAYTDVEIVAYTLEAKEVDEDDGETDGVPRADDIADVPRRLAAGQLRKWMPGVEELPATAKVEILIKSGPDDADKRRLFGGANSLVLSLDYTATNAVTKVYKGLAGVEMGETPPTGLAEILYNDLQKSRWRGTVTLSEDQCGDTATRWVGKLINVDGGRAGWATMDAVCYASREDIFTGITVLTLDTPGILSPGDWFELLRGSKESPITYRTGAERASADAEEADVIEGESAGANDSVTAEADYGNLQPLEFVRAGGAAAWKVWVEDAKVIGWTADGTAVTDITQSGTAWDVDWSGAKTFAVEISLSASDEDPMWKVTAAELKQYDTGTVPANDLPTEGGGTGKVYIEVVTVTAGATDDDPPIIDPQDWIGHLPCFEPVVPVGATTGSSGSDSGSGDEEDHIWQTMVEDVSVLVSDFGTNGFLLSLYIDYYDLLVKDASISDPPTVQKDASWECECVCDCCESGSGSTA